jgi:hypothetical protein
MLRGSRDFANVTEYQTFLGKLFSRLNAGRRARLAEEMRGLRPLQERRIDTTRRIEVRASPGSLIRVQRNSYSVPSRLIGELVEVGLKAIPWKSGTASERWKSYRGCAGAANAWIAGTSLIGWCANWG